MTTGISNLVSRALPQVVSNGALTDPRSASSVELLRTLAAAPPASAYAPAHAGAPFRENMQLALPNPMVRLGALLSRPANGSDFLQGRRTLEDETSVTLPRLAQRCGLQARRAGELSDRLGRGEFRSVESLMQTVDRLLRIRADISRGKAQTVR